MWGQVLLIASAFAGPAAGVLAVLSKETGLVVGPLVLLAYWLGEANRRQSTSSVASTIAPCTWSPRKHWSVATAGAYAGVKASAAIW